MRGSCQSLLSVEVLDSQRFRPTSGQGNGSVGGNRRSPPGNSYRARRPVMVMQAGMERADSPDERSGAA
jgi:hypothetical protein